MSARARGSRSQSTPFMTTNPIANSEPGSNIVPTEERYSALTGSTYEEYYDQMRFTQSGSQINSELDSFFCINFGYTNDNHWDTSDTYDDNQSL
jgi:hypothetical protein